MPLSEKLLEIIVCPVCKGKLEYQSKNEKLTCQVCQVAYPVSDNIPVLLADESEKL